MPKSKFQQLLERKQKIEEELAKEVDKRMMQIAKMAKQEKITHWSDEGIKALFKHARTKTENYYLSQSEEAKKAKNEKPQID